MHCSCAERLHKAMYTKHDTFNIQMVPVSFTKLLTCISLHSYLTIDRNLGLHTKNIDLSKIGWNKITN